MELHLWRVIWFSVWESVVTVVVAVIGGGGLALWEYYWKVVSPRWFRAVMLLPVFLPSAIVALGFIAVWGKAGYLNTILIWLNLPQLQLLYSPTAIIVSHCFYNLPLAYLAIQLRLQSTGYTLDETAQTLGAGLGTRWWRVLLPRLRGTISGISVLIFLYAFMSFALPLILGGIRYQTVEVYIYSLVIQQHDLPAALAVAVLQWFGLTMLLLLAQHQTLIFGERQLQITQPSQNKKIVLIRTVQIISAGFILAPVLAVALAGWQPDNLTTLRQIGFTTAIMRTLGLAGGTMIVIGLLALMIVRWLPTTLHRGVFLLLAVSPVTLGVVWRLLGSPSLFQLGSAYGVMLLPVIVYWLRTWWLTRLPAFDETLLVLGANARQRWVAYSRYLRPALIQSLTLGSIMIIGDIALSTLLAPASQPTMMSLNYRLLGSYRFSLAATGMSLTLGCIGVVIMFSSVIQYRYGARRS